MEDKYRDRSGHFTNAENDGGECKHNTISSKNSAKEFRQNASYAEILRDRAVVSMTKQEWALWYKAVGEVFKLGHKVNATPNGYLIIKIETELSSKIVITSGTFENPVANAIYSFKNLDDLNDTIERIKNYGKK